MVFATGAQSGSVIVTSHPVFSGKPMSNMADTGVVETLLKRLEKLDGGVDSVEVASSLGVDHQLIVGAVKSLQTHGDVRFSAGELPEV